MTTFEFVAILTVGGVLSGWASGILAALAREIWEFFAGLTNLVIVRLHCQSGAPAGNPGTSVLVYLNDHYRRFDLGTLSIFSRYLYFHSEGSFRNSAFQDYERTGVLFFYQGAPIWVSSSNNNTDAPGTTLSFFRFTVNWPNLVKKAFAYELEYRDRHPEKSSRYTVVRFTTTDNGELVGGDRGTRRRKSSCPDNVVDKTRAVLQTMAVRRSEEDDTYAAGKSPQRFAAVHPLWDAWEDIIQPPSPTPLDLLSLNPEIQQVVDEIQFWYAHADWYAERGIPWRRGYLFWGRPGTGKTSLSRALAEHLGIPLFTFDLSRMTNEAFLLAWSDIHNNSPCMVLIEDTDSTFDGRKNISGMPKALSFDCLLNCVDGVQTANGILFIMSTNKLESVDEALGVPSGKGVISSRPGRLDRAVEFTTLTAASRLKMVKRIVSDASAHARLVEEGASDTAAQFQERCFQAATAALWAHIQ